MTRLVLLILIVPSFAFASGWECINHNFSSTGSCNTWRWQVPHGWLVSTDNLDKEIAMVFYPDEKHEWKA